MSGLVIPTGVACCPRGAEAGLEVRLFGPMEVRVGSQPLPRLHSRKGLWLLALLALRAGREVERDWLAGVLWPECDEPHGRRSLRQSLYDLRAALGPEAPRLTAPGSRTLRLDLGGAFADAPAFDAAVSRGDPASLEAAVRLYRGPLLEDCSEEWCLQERGPREQAYLGALAALAAAATARGEHASSAGYLRLALAVDPYREELQRSLMQALFEGGSPAECLLVYRRFSDLLRREMAAEPAEETTALFRRLREETRSRPKPAAAARRTAAAPPSPAGAFPVPRALPLPLTALVGRQEAVQEVMEQLEQARLVTLTGTGGIGKTRLALQVATQLAPQFPDGVWFVELAALADEALVGATVTAALGIGEATDRPVLERLWQSLAEREVLLALDNCEHLVAGCAQLVDGLLRRCMGLRILTTSRQPLGVTGEVTWRVPSLELPGAAILPNRVKDAVSYFLGYDAVRLFLARAQEADPRFRLNNQDAGTVAQLCRQLDGIPLAIELAAARVRAMPVKQLAQRLDDRFRLLTGGSRAALPRQQTLRATLDWSYDLLSEPERALLRRLSVFAGGWTLEGAEAVCGDCGLRIADCGLSGPDSIRSPQSAIRNEEVLDLLASLVDKSLVVYEGPDGFPPGGARYRLLETVRQYSGERLLEDETGDAVHARHLDYYLLLAEDADAQLQGAQQGEWLERLETEHDNLRAALDWCLAARTTTGGLTDDEVASDEIRSDPITRHPGPLRGQPLVTSPPAVVAGRVPMARSAGTPRSVVDPHEAGLRLAGALGWFWTMRGYLTEGRRRLAQALTKAGGAGTPGAGGATRAKALNAAGNLACRQADYRAARSLHEESLAVRRLIGDHLGIASSLNNLGLIAYAEGDYGVTRSLFEASLMIRRELGDRWNIAASLHNLGSVAYAQGDYGAARSLYEEALIIRRELGDRWCIAGSLNNLGLVAYAQGDHGAARSLQEENLSIRRELADPLGIAGALEALAELAGEAAGQPGAGAVPGAGGREVESAGRAGAGWRAARLFGAAEALRETIGAPVPPNEQAAHDRQVSRLREILGEEAFAAAWAEGQAMTVEQAIGDALDETGTE